MTEQQIMYAMISMARESLAPESYESLLKICHELCNARKALDSSMLEAVDDLP